ncbi:TlpA family protein disulfide reductase [Lysobacter sp. TY2-98]|uniref:TlpA family protein disulfide reductase n=1 Tax=Lysobacter sp. TY2-98 TaxID=2290922 RepID=UPI000E1FD0AA|nr:TlpA disulfide reductase family protein [Lysobacter sp. TY2-98]AXK72571.1 TlpA family protein disulfide reductase [Lysobacter sp. TY2-98]
MTCRLLPLLLALGLAACGERATTPTAASTPSKPSTPASAKPAAATPPDREHPQLQIELVDGARYDLTQHRGKWVVVNFWATWCGPCLKEMPELSTLAQRGDVDVIGLAYEDITKADMQAFLKTHTPSYPIAILDTFNPPRDFDAPQGLPMTVVVAPDGHVAKKFLGPVTLAAIDEVVKGSKG